MRALVSDLINYELHLWKTNQIMEMFEKEDAEAICRIPLSRRNVEDSIVWLPNKKGLFTVKSAYEVARELMRGENVAESSSGCAGKRVWAALWKLEIPSKVKVFGWKACNEILPTKMNLAKRRIIADAVCLICTRFQEIAMHVLWGCDAAQDVWTGSSKSLQKGNHGMIDMFQLLEYLMERLALEDLELMLVQAWLI